MHAIKTEGLTKHYTVGFWRPRPYVALDGLSLEVAPAEIFGFLGPNGAGKTTTLKLLMRLGDSGCTVFFSSHILGDAESLCSRVAILAGGRLVTTGRLADMVGFELRGWELIVSDVSREKLTALGTRVTRIVPLAHGRFSLELPPDPPEALIAELARHGGRHLPLNPVRDTLEDLLVRQ